MAAAIDTGRLESLGLLNKPKPEEKELGQSEFLKLMTTQLQNQDPFKPMESGDFLAQIAQFSTVNGIEGLQKSFEQLSTSLVSNQALQASSLVGRNVLIPSNEAVLLGNGEPVNAAIDLLNSAEQVSVEITDQSGQLVRQDLLGPQRSGRIEFSWDGADDDGNPMPSGVYNIRAIANSGGEQIDAETLITAPVESVSLGNEQGGISLNLVGLGSRDFSQVREIR